MGRFCMLVLFIAVFLAILIDGKSSAANPVEWSYKDPDGWNNKFKKECGGNQQSPISINPLTDHIIQRAPAPFRFINYNQKLMMTITNDGHSVQLSIPSNYPYSTRPRISGGGLEGQYIFARAHFHWGSRSSRGGSEHVINHRRYAAEMHLVHFNAKYGSLKNAEKYRDGVAVLGVLIAAGPSFNDAYKPIMTHLKNIRTKGSKFKLSQPLRLYNFLPRDNVNSFYRYHGSLTTPRCLEIVEWTIFDTPQTISTSQLAQFNQLYDSHGQPVGNHFRPVQRKHGRPIYHYRNAVRPRG